MIRKANAIWYRTGRGRDELSSNSGVFAIVSYPLGTQSGSGRGAAPEEPIAAAHARCNALLQHSLDDVHRRPAAPSRLH